MGGGGGAFVVLSKVPARRCIATPHGICVRSETIKLLSLDPKNDRNISIYRSRRDSRIGEAPPDINTGGGGCRGRIDPVAYRAQRSEEVAATATVRRAKKGEGRVRSRYSSIASIKVSARYPIQSLAASRHIAAEVRDRAAQEAECCSNLAAWEAN